MLEVWVTSTQGERRPLWSYGNPGPVRFSSLWRRAGGCGDFRATVTLDVPAGATPAGLALGAALEVRDCGLLVFAGDIIAPDQGRPWTLTAFGPITETFSTRGVTTPDVAIDAAISRGWDVARPTSIGSGAIPGSGTPGEVAYVSVPDLLDAYAEGAGVRWGITTGRDLFTTTDATTPTWVYTPADAVQGLADENYATTVELYYVSALAGTPPAPSAWSRVYATTPASVEAASLYAPREVFVDVTDRGLLSSGEANILANAVLTSYGPTLHYDTPLTLDAGNLVHFASGAPGRPSQVRAGEVVRMAGVFDNSGVSISGTVADVLLGEVEYDEENDQATGTPFDSGDRSLLGAVEKAWTASVATRRKNRMGVAA